MAKTAQPKKKAGPAPVEPAAGDGPPESLDKVRDILFGGQMRMVDSRLRALEDRLQEEQKTLRSDFTRQLGEMDTAIRKELVALNDRLAAERAKRAEDLKALSAELKEALRSLEKRHSKLEETASLADADLRDQILQQGAALSADIGRLAERTAAELDRAVQELQSAKLDTVTLASVLTDMAGRLGGNGKGSGKGSSRG